MSIHKMTCDAPHCPYFDELESNCRKARPTGFQPNLRVKEYWPLWPQVQAGIDWCGEHPSIRAYVNGQLKEPDNASSS